MFGMQKRFPGLLLITAFLTACGGGGGSSSPVPSGGGSPPGPTIASVSGKVVDDTSGAALSGASVGLAPWVADATPVPEGTTAPDGTFTFTAQPGHYLLIIGSNAPTDTARATIHDNVTLVAGTNALQAPVLPPWPTVTPPAWELNGSYRLQTIDATTELPCFNAYNAQRASHGLPQVVFDEWLKENTRDAEHWHTGGQYDPSKQTSASRALGANSFAGGGTDCVQTLIAPIFLDAHTAETLNLHNLWFGGRWVYWTPQGQTNAQGDGLAEFPIDPRFQSDPLGYPWI